MKAIVKLTIAALASAVLCAVAAEAINAKAPAHHVPQPQLTRGAAGKGNQIDWQGAMTRSFGDRFLGRGPTSDPSAPIRMFEGMKRI